MKYPKINQRCNIPLPSFSLIENSIYLVISNILKDKQKNRITLYNSNIKNKKDQQVIFVGENEHFMLIIFVYSKA